MFLKQISGGDQRALIFKAHALARHFTGYFENYELRVCQFYTATIS